MLEFQVSCKAPGYIEKPAKVKAGEEKIMGRSHQCDIVISHPEVSRKHCRIINDGQTCTILDLGSVNGLFVNGERVANRVLADGDVITICTVNFDVAIRDKDPFSDSSVMLIEGEGDGGIKQRISFAPTRILSDIQAPSDVDDLRKAHANLSLIAKISNLIFDSSKIEEKLNLVLRTIVESFSADRGCILIINPATRKIEPKAVYKLSGGTDANIGLSKTIVNEAVDKGLSVLSSNVIDDSRFVNSDSVADLNISSVMCVPLEGKSGVIGVVYIDSVASRNTFNEENLKVLNTIGYQVGAAIQQSWLERDLRRSSKELEEYSKRLEFKVSERTSSLSRAIERLKETDKLKSQFLANMSHELRTPLNAIVGFASLIQDRVYGEISARQEDAIIKVKQNAEHLLGMINSILDISRIDAGRMPVYPEEFDPNYEIREVAEGFLSLAKDDVAVQFALDTSLKQVYNDKGKFRQVVRNLLANALKFTEKGTVALVTGQREGERVFSFAIHDTGVGIADDHLSVIFDEFRQVDGSKTRRFEGSGLGLAICRRLVQLMGGRIEVISRLGEGSTFTCLMPIDIRDVIEEAHRLTDEEGDNAARAEPAKPSAESPETKDIT